MNNLLSKRELEALGECAKPSTTIYCGFKPATMQKLAMRGFVELCNSKYIIYWKITEAGREHLRGFPSR